MTKADIVNEISKDLGLEKRLVLEVVEAFMENVRNSLIENNPVYLRGFGTFNLKKRAAKTARNITKKETIIVPEHYIPAFKPCPEFQSRVAEVKEVKE